MEGIKNELRALVQSYSSGFNRTPLGLNIYVTEEVINEQIKRLDALELAGQNRHQPVIGVS